MALKTILLRKKLQEAQKREAELRSKLSSFSTRESELTQAIEEANTEEEISTVQEQVEALEKEMTEVRTSLDDTVKEVQKYMDDIAEAERAQEAAIDTPEASAAGNETGIREARQRGEVRSMPNRMTLREAQEFQRTGRHTYQDVRSLIRSTVLSTSTGIVGPTGVSGINDPVGNNVSSLIDLIHMEDCTGMSSHKVSFEVSDAADAAAITEGSAPTEGEPTFGSVEMTPTNYGTIAYISKEIRKQSPLAYEEKVTASARRSLRRKLNSVAAAAILASSLNDTLALTGAASATKGSELFDADLLNQIILSYGGDEGIEGAATLFLAKADLKAFAAVRGKNEYLPVYTILPDAANPSTGVIKDNHGLSCRYCLSKDVTSLAEASLTTTAKKTMFYGNPQCAELDLWGGFDVETSDGYKFAEGLITVRGEVTGDVDVTVNKGFVVVTAKKASA